MRKQKRANRDRMSGFGASGTGEFSSGSGIGSRIDFGDFQSKLAQIRSNITQHEEMA